MSEDNKHSCKLNIYPLFESGQKALLSILSDHFTPQLWWFFSLIQHFKCKTTSTEYCLKSIAFSWLPIAHRSTCWNAWWMQWQGIFEAKFCFPYNNDIHSCIVILLDIIKYSLSSFDIVVSITLVSQQGFPKKRHVYFL